MKQSMAVASVRLYLELLKGKDMDDSWQEAQHTDFLAWEHEAEEVLKATAFRPLTDDERHLLAWAMGKQNLFQERA
jgi:hypothetical protein